MSTEIKRSIVMSHYPVEGFFKYKDKFQIMPPVGEVILPPDQIGIYPCFIEFSFNKPLLGKKLSNGVETPEWSLIQDAGRKTINKLVLVLSTITTNRYFFLSNRKSWYVSHGIRGEEKKFQSSEWGQESYHISNYKYDVEGFSPQGKSAIKLYDHNKYYNRKGYLTDYTIDLPNNINLLLDKYYSIDDEKRDYFLSACSLFNQGVELWGSHPSLSFTAITSALEALIHYNHKDEEVEKCPECNQNRYKLTRKFIDFFDTYGVSDANFKKYAKKIYTYRSKILHTGKLFMGEIKPLDFDDFSNFEDDEFRRSIVRTSRICITNWLLMS